MSAIVDRIQKLLAKGRDSSVTEAEAQAFMTKAQELMLEHNLSMATLEGSGGKGDNRVKDENKQSLMFAWKRELLHTLAEVNFCSLTIVHGKTANGEKIANGYDLIGRTSNVTVCKHQFAYLLNAVERVLVDEVGTSPQARYNRFAHTFRQGCSERLRDRLKERFEDSMRKQAAKAREANQRASETHPKGGNALIVVLEDYHQAEVDANLEVINGLEPGTLARRRAEREVAYKKWEVERTAKKAKLKEAYPHAPNGVIELMVGGMTFEEACKKHAEWTKPETDAQRRKREQRDANWNRNYEERESRKNAHRRSEGFRRGRDRAEDIGLDEQVDGTITKKLGD